MQGSKLFVFRTVNRTNRASTGANRSTLPSACDARPHFRYRRRSRVPTCASGSRLRADPASGLLGGGNLRLDLLALPADFC